MATNWNSKSAKQFTLQVGAISITHLAYNAAKKELRKLIDECNEFKGDKRVTAHIKSKIKNQTQQVVQQKRKIKLLQRGLSIISGEIKNKPVGTKYMLAEIAK